MRRRLRPRLSWLDLAALGLALALVFALTQPGVSRPPPGFPTFVLVAGALACFLGARWIGL